MTATWTGPIGLDVAGCCTACGLCLATCPEGALAPAPRKPVAIVWRCTACLACIEVCPVDAITVTVEGSVPLPGREAGPLSDPVVRRHPARVER